MKDIDPEECMNMVKAFVNAANTYRDGTYGAYYRTVGRYLRYLRYYPYEGELVSLSIMACTAVISV